jgi:hypothetical protein
MRARRRQRDRESHQNRYRPPCCRSGCPRTGTRPCNILHITNKKRVERRDQQDVLQLTVQGRGSTRRRKQMKRFTHKEETTVRQIRLRTMNNEYSGIQTPPRVGRSFVLKLLSSKHDNTIGIQQLCLLPQN